ncbi:hypothetical protein [Rhodococcus sp. NPDC055024]
MTETVTEQALSIQPIVDGHNDLPIASKYKRDYSVEGLDTGVPDLHTDIPRLRAGGRRRRAVLVAVRSVEHQ